MSIFIGRKTQFIRHIIIATESEKHEAKTETYFFSLSSLHFGVNDTRLAAYHNESCWLEGKIEKKRFSAKAIKSKKSILSLPILKSQNKFFNDNL